MNSRKTKTAEGFSKSYQKPKLIKIKRLRKRIVVASGALIASP
jgi:hypothetical protein